MAIQNNVEHGFEFEGNIHFELSKTSECPKGEPSGKMITDSDGLAFVYLFEQDAGYGQLRFPEEVWPSMVDALAKDADPVLAWQGEKIPLVGFKDELMMLIYNIEGNDNYGEAFSTAVEHAFGSILQSAE
ncbi:hypothetical protein AB1K83_02495 [Sporosarcina sp. 179-K 3D1 HS]|uniref:UPF0738 family protein n=1 Tax=Sporosarcina sp. 179-K 3D1 HS TaxID=3232169 RepID=UPI0039A11279